MTAPRGKAANRFRVGSDGPRWGRSRDNEIRVIERTRPAKRQASQMGDEMDDTQILPRQRASYAEQVATRAKELEVTRSWDFGELNFNMTTQWVAVGGWASKADQIRDFAAMLMLVANTVEEIERINPTPERSGEADKTAEQDLAGGESGLPEGSSK